MWMAGDELRMAAPSNRGEVALPILLEQQREEVRLEEEVAELVFQLGRVTGERGIRDLVRLFDRVRNDRARRLLAVPGAVAAQPLGQLLKFEKGRAELLPLSQWWGCWCWSACSRPGTPSRLPGPCACP
jgi:hypothetical protein